MFQGINIGSPNIFHGSGIFKVVYGLLVSPLLTLIISFGFYLIIYKCSVKNSQATKLGNKITYSLCVFLMMMAITFTFASMYEIPEVEGFLMNKKLFGLILGVLVGFFTSLLYFFFLLPQLLKMKGDLRISFSVFSKRKENPSAGKGNSTEIIEMMEDRDSLEERDEIKRIFRPLQVLAACFGALSHGSNDVGNCIGPLVTMWHIYKSPIDYTTDTPVYGVLFWGGLGIALGLICFGERVIVTMGSKISRVTPSLGFTVVMTASIVVMVCSIAGIPTSTTHCQVMGVVGAGVARGWIDTGSIRDGLNTIDFKLIGSIAMSWIVTIPFSLVLSTILYAAVRVVVIGPF